MLPTRAHNAMSPGPSPRLAKATVVIPTDFLRRPLIGLVGFVFHAEPVSAAVMIGPAIVDAGNCINVRAEQGGRHRLRRRGLSRRRYGCATTCGVGARSGTASSLRRRSPQTSRSPPCLRARARRRAAAFAGSAGCSTIGTSRSRPVATTCSWWRSASKFADRVVPAVRRKSTHDASGLEGVT